ncbi:MAG TPA: hypothetical protein VH593_20400 [Ktedonobacteraceae bacterium]
MPPRYSRTTTNIAATTGTAGKKGSPARQVVKSRSESPSVMGFSRATTATTIDGKLASSSSTVSSTGGAGGFLGPALIFTGVFFLWIVFRGKSGAMWNAITGNSGFDADLNKIASAIPITSSGGSGGGGSKSPAPVTGNQSDSGTHMGIDPGGNIITINSDYGSMTPEQKDAANAYAHQIGNVG